MDRLQVSAAVYRHRISVLLLAMLCGSAFADAPAPTLDARPKTLPELLAAFDHTFSQILTPEEYESYKTKKPDEIEAAFPELYQKIRQNVKRWTAAWIENSRRHLDTVPPQRVAAARQEVEQVDDILRKHFQARGWPYRSMDVVFLPQRVLFNASNRSEEMKGAFLGYYPEVFFATLDPSFPRALLLIHESLHFNSRSNRYGSRLMEGITETGARQIVLEHALQTKGQVRSVQAYELERGLVDFILRRIVERSECSPQEAVEILLASYITGDHSTLQAVFGRPAWDQVVAVSREPLNWSQLEHAVRQALER